jgi:hypothetical protein
LPSAGLEPATPSLGRRRSDPLSYEGMLLAARQREVIIDIRRSGRSSARLECTVRDREVGGSNPLAPTIFRNEPFGENVEGLSHFRDKSCVIKTAVQKHDFEQSTLCNVISSNRRKRTTRLVALARLCRHREAFLKPRFPERCLVGDGSGRLIAVKVEAQHNYARAAAVEGAKGGDARPRLVEP